jgi:hypothetical protein
MFDHARQGRRCRTTPSQPQRSAHAPLQPANGAPGRLVPTRAGSGARSSSRRATRTGAFLLWTWTTLSSRRRSRARARIGERSPRPPSHSPASPATAGVPAHRTIITIIRALPSCPVSCPVVETRSTREVADPGGTPPAEGPAGQLRCPCGLLKLGPPGVDSSNRPPVATPGRRTASRRGSRSPRPLRSWPWAIQCRAGSCRSGSSGRPYDHLLAYRSSAPIRQDAHALKYRSRYVTIAGRAYRARSA